MKSQKTLFCGLFFLVLFIQSPFTGLNQFNYVNGEASENQIGESPKYFEESAFSLDENGNLILTVNLTIQIVLVGYDASVTYPNLLEDLLQKEWEVIRDNHELGYVVNYNTDYDIVLASEAYSNAAESYAQSISTLTYTSLINETALLLQSMDKQARKVFSTEQFGYEINATAMDEWFADNPYIQEPENGYSIYVLNNSALDTIDHSTEHWFAFDDVNIDSNRTLDWFRLEWDNALNPEVRFPYPGFDSKFANRYILDPSAYQWYHRWSILWYYQEKVIFPHSYHFMDLDEFCRNYSLSSANPQDLAIYLGNYLEGVLSLMVLDGSLGNSKYVSSQSISVQTLVVNADEEFNKPLEDITWVTSEERISSQLEYAMPFIDWDINVDFANLTEYPIIQEAIQNSLNPTTVPDFWMLDSNSIWYNLFSQRHKLFDMDAADEVITAIVIIRKDMVMQVGSNNFTGMGGSGNVVCLKSRDRYFELDGITPKSGITEVMIHEIGHNLGFGHPGKAGEYSRGTMTYYNTRHEFNEFYVDILARGMVEMRYCDTTVRLKEFLERYGSEPITPTFDNLVSEIVADLENTITEHNKMNYYTAIDMVNQAQTKMNLLESLQEDYFGNIQKIGSNPRGLTETVFVDNNKMYTVGGNELQVFDVTTPSAPNLLSTLELTEYCLDIYVTNGYAYLSHSDQGFSIIDISDSLNPFVVSKVTDFTSKVVDLHVCGDFLYVGTIKGSDYDYGLRIYELNNPEKPILIRQLGFGIDVRRITSSGDYLYLGIGGTLLNGTLYSGVWVYNISNPYNMESLSGYYDSSHAYQTEMFIMGDTLYLTQVGIGGYQLTLIDISNPISPVYDDTVTLPNLPTDVHVTTSYAFVACVSSGMVVVDTATKTIVTSFNASGTPFGLYIEGNYAFLAGIETIAIVDISTISSLSEVYSYDLQPATTIHFEIKDNYLFANDAENGVSIFDISNLASPELVNYIILPKGTSDVKIEGDYLYVMGRDYKLAIYDITTPSSPAKLGSCEIATRPYRFEVRGDYVYLPANSEFLVIDASDKNNPTIVGNVSTMNYAQSVALIGDIAYVNCEFYGLQVIDVNDPANPTVLATLDIGAVVYDIIIENNRAYVGHSNGITVLDTSTPESPVILFNYTYQGCQPFKFTMQNNQLYSAEGLQGFHIYDISDPNTLREIGYNNTYLSATDIDFYNGAIIASCNRGGLFIFAHDLDNDTLSSLEEAVFGSDPYLFDTDFDGYSDYEEWLAGTDPTDPNDYPGVQSPYRDIIIGGAIIGGSLSIGIITTSIIIRRRKKVH